MQFARIHRARAELHTLLQPVLLPCFQLLNDNVNIGKGSYCCCCSALPSISLYAVTTPSPSRPAVNFSQCGTRHFFVFPVANFCSSRPPRLDLGVWRHHSDIVLLWNPVSRVWSFFDCILALEPSLISRRDRVHEQ
jgi:hypothetical protein